MKKKVLVIVEDYPSLYSHNRMYVHVRNKYYQRNGIDVTVLSFKAKHNYSYDNIQVITYSFYKKNKKSYDVLCSHAPNIKHHYFFLKKYAHNFNKIILFFHGQEIIRWNVDYPKEYSFRKWRHLKRIIRSFYDELKLLLWHKEIKRIIHKSHLVFVSNYLFNKFKQNVKLNEQLITNKYSIINNSVGEFFEKNSYTPKKMLYDFITIRGEGLDESCKCIDIVTQLAINNPQMKFLVIGKGNYFNYITKPENIIFENKILNHEQIIKYSNQAKCALLPTRQDTQGVSACEMATFGIPLITSDIDVCKEIFNGFTNVSFINNNDLNNIDLSRIISSIIIDNKKNKKYFAENTIKKEVDIINEEK